MIIWLASYPRSGNTLLRLILNRVFRKVSYSKYDDTLDIGNNEELRSEVGHESLNGVWQDRYKEMCDTDKRYFVKTHEPPEDGQAAIYVVRSGLDAVYSYYKYLADIAGRDVTMGEVIAGSAGHFPSWGRHLDMWNPLERENTLLVRYEDLCHSADAEIQRIRSFCEMEQKDAWVNEFQKLQAINPKFFRKGDDAQEKTQIATQEEIEMFHMLHGDWMRKLGYPAEEAFDCISSIRTYIDPRLAMEAKQRNLASKEIAGLRNQLEAEKALREQFEQDLAAESSKRNQSKKELVSLKGKLKNAEAFKDKLEKIEVLKRQVDQELEDIQQKLGRTALQLAGYRALEAKHRFLFRVFRNLSK